MGVCLLQVLAGAGDVEGHSNHLDSQLHGCLQQVPAALQREAEGHAGLSCVGLGGQLQQQPRWHKQTEKKKNVSQGSKHEWKFLTLTGFANVLFIFSSRTKIMYFSIKTVIRPTQSSVLQKCMRIKSSKEKVLNLMTYFALGCRREILDNSASFSHTRCWMLFFAACLMCASCLQTPERMMFSGGTPCSSTRLISVWGRKNKHIKWPQQSLNAPSKQSKKKGTKCAA